MTYTNIYDLYAPVLWKDAGGDVVYGETIIAAYLNGNGDACTYEYVVPPVFAPDGTHTLEGKVGIGFDSGTSDSGPWTARANDVRTSPTVRSGALNPSGTGLTFRNRTNKVTSALTHGDLDSAYIVRPDNTSAQVAGDTATPRVFTFYLGAQVSWHTGGANVEYVTRTMSVSVNATLGTFDVTYSCPPGTAPSGQTTVTGPNVRIRRADNIQLRAITDVQADGGSYAYAGDAFATLGAIELEIYTEGVSVADTLTHNVIIVYDGTLRWETGAPLDVVEPTLEVIANTVTQVQIKPTKLISIDGGSP